MNAFPKKYVHLRVAFEFLYPSAIKREGMTYNRKSQIRGML